MRLTMEWAKECLNKSKAEQSALWVGHSRSTGMAAFLLAQRIPGMDPELAGCYGMLHDIGRAFGDRTMQINHIFKGYHFLMGEGHPEAARICLTHSFPMQDIRSVVGVWDCTREDYEFLEEYLEKIVYTPYDRLIQFCDNIALPEGIAILEKRLVDIVRRYGNDPRNLLSRWDRLFSIKEELEENMGCSVEDALDLGGIRQVPELFWEGICKEGLA